MSGVTIRQADDEALAYVETLLETNGLPSRDVRANVGRFYVGYRGGDRIGVGGIESYGAVGLLRSVVVERTERGQGFGHAICEELEARARTNGVDTLYLLTTTASEFFDRRGYDEVDRDDVPAAIQRTTEFDELCPATAVCMKKRL